MSEPAIFHQADACVLGYPFLQGTLSGALYGVPCHFNALRKNQTKTIIKRPSE